MINLNSIALVKVTTLYIDSKLSKILEMVRNATAQDKTGTMTEGVFKVQEVIFKPEFNKDEILSMVNVLESKSTHPVATAIHQFVGDIKINNA